MSLAQITALRNLPIKHLWTFYRTWLYKCLHLVIYKSNCITWYNQCKHHVSPPLTKLSYFTHVLTQFLAHFLAHMQTQCWRAKEEKRPQQCLPLRLQLKCFSSTSKSYRRASLQGGRPGCRTGSEGNRVDPWQWKDNMLSIYPPLFHPLLHQPIEPSDKAAVSKPFIILCGGRQLWSDESRNIYFTLNSMYLKDLHTKCVIEGSCGLRPFLIGQSAERWISEVNINSFLDRH